MGRAVSLSGVKTQVLAQGLEADVRNAKVRTRMITSRLTKRKDTSTAACSILE